MGLGKQVIVLTKENQLQVWGTITQCCKENEDFSYWTLSARKFPFDYKGWKFRKVFYNSI